MSSTAATGEIRVGTRGSALALAQADLVIRAFEGAGHRPRRVIIETEGDRRASDLTFGEGAFVAAIEQALLAGDVDVAVHSAKDVPTTMDARLVIGAYLPRADPRDVLVVREGSEARSLDDLPRGARVGTDSPRRTGFILARRPDLVLHPLHGNVDTRLRRLEAGETDALILAAAGLDRLGRSDRIAERLDPHVVPPAPGQGAIAIQVRADDTRLLALCRAIDHLPTRQAVEAERAFLAATGGGCRSPIGALATIDDGTLELLGGFAEVDGSATSFARVRGPASDATALGRELAGRLGDRHLATPRRRVLVLRPAGQAVGLVHALARAELDAVVVPAISIEPVAVGGALDDAVARLGDYDWVVVTSRNGAQSLVAAAARCSVALSGPRWAAVGEATPRPLIEAGVSIDFQPTRKSGMGLAVELPVTAGERLLLVRGDLADARLPDRLRARQADVDEVVAYRTHEAPEGSAALLADALTSAPIDAILFTSGSTVGGLVALAAEAGLEVTSIPSICIGSETSAAARRAGFTVAAEAPAPDIATLVATTAFALMTRDKEAG